jgi:hypothetical protein
VKEQKSPRGEILLLPKRRRDAAVLKHKDVSRSAERDKGSAPLTAPPFEKGGRKLSAFFNKFNKILFALGEKLP